MTIPPESPEATERARKRNVAERIAAGVDITTGQPLPCEMACRYPHLCCDNHCVATAGPQPPSNFRLSLVHSSS